MGRVARITQNVSVVLLAAASGFAAEPSELAALNLSALVYREAGDYGRARQAAERALGIVQAEKLAETVEGARVFANLGGIAEMQGETAEAKTWLARALEIRERLLGAAHPQVAETLNDLALAYSMEGRLDTAGGLYRRALGILEAGDFRNELAGGASGDWAGLVEFGGGLFSREKDGGGGGGLLAGFGDFGAGDGA